MVELGKKLAIAAGIMCLIGCAGKEQRLSRPYISTTTANAGVGAASGAVLGAVGTAGNPAGALVGAAAGSLIGFDIQKRESAYLQQLARLKATGVKVTHVGDEITIHLASSNYFYGNTPRLKSKANRTLYELSQFINMLPIHVVEVAGYTGDQGSRLRNLALSRMRADFIVDKLTEMGVGTRLVYAVGYGELGPLASHDSLRGPYVNNRIEVILNPHYRWYGA